LVRAILWIKSTLPAYDDKLIVLRGPTTFP
jgi:hypothetical protein